MAWERPTELRVALVQMHCGNDPSENLRRAVEFVRQAGDQGAGLVCLPELFRTTYFCQQEVPELFDLAEPIPGPTTDALARAASVAHVAVIGSVFERRAPGLYHNTAVVLGADGTLAGVYRKLHIPHDPLYFEKYYFTPGDLGVRVFSVAGWKVSVLVCWDQWFPEAARLAALSGAEVILYPTAIGWHPAEKAEHGADQYQAWQTVQRAHAIANGIYVAACNRVGIDDRLEFWGGSFACDPFGRVIVQASHEREELLWFGCARTAIEDTRRNWPFLRDRRTDAYSGLLKRFLDDSDL
ncbi:MAG: carbon-nitrogen hydrolase [Candidatus Binatia bacterium]|nr:carbon-nitrogen hydrolase [Candidatus Binatia bacterium]